MSSGEVNSQAEGDVLHLMDGLEEAVEAALSRIHELERQLGAARRRATEAVDLLRRFSEGEEAPSEMAQRLKKLEAENRDLLDRVTRGREGVKRMLARIRFLEEKG